MLPEDFLPERNVTASEKLDVNPTKLKNLDYRKKCFGVHEIPGGLVGSLILKSANPRITWLLLLIFIYLFIFVDILIRDYSYLLLCLNMYYLSKN